MSQCVSQVIHRIAPAGSVPAGSFPIYSPQSQHPLYMAVPTFIYGGPNVGRGWQELGATGHTCGCGLNGCADTGDRRPFDSGGRVERARRECHESTIAWRSRRASSDSLAEAAALRNREMPL